MFLAHSHHMSLVHGPSSPTCTNDTDSEYRKSSPCPLHPPPKIEQHLFVPVDALGMVDILASHPAISSAFIPRAAASLRKHASPVPQRNPRPSPFSSLASPASHRSAQVSSPSRPPKTPSKQTDSSPLLFGSASSDCISSWYFSHVFSPNTSESSPTSRRRRRRRFPYHLPKRPDVSELVRPHLHRLVHGRSCFQAPPPAPPLAAP